MNHVVLSADLGGTNMRMAAVSLSGETLHVARRPTPENVSPIELLELTELLAIECREAVTGVADVKAIAFGSPAPAARHPDGVLTKLPNLPSLNGMKLGSALRERFSLPVTLENDATAAAIGESWLGASKNAKNSVMITLGTGVGGGIIIDREPYRGIDGTAGEIGHTTVEPGGHPCGCGSIGCLEQYASATALVRLAHESGLSVKTARELYEAAESGDESARTVFAAMGRYLGITLAGVINILNPEVIVIGGGVASGWNAFVEFAKAEIRRRSYEAPAIRADLVRSALGDKAGLLGAARSAFLDLGYNP